MLDKYREELSLKKSASESGIRIVRLMVNGSLSIAYSEK